MGEPWGRTMLATSVSILVSSCEETRSSRIFVLVLHLKCIRYHQSSLSAFLTSPKCRSKSEPREEIIIITITFEETDHVTSRLGTHQSICHPSRNMQSITFQHNWNHNVTIHHSRSRVMYSDMCIATNLCLYLSRNQHACEHQRQQGATTRVA